jgi:hypothetical protein
MACCETAVTVIESSAATAVAKPRRRPPARRCAGCRARSLLLHGANLLLKLLLHAAIEALATSRGKWVPS